MGAQPGHSSDSGDEEARLAAAGLPPATCGAAAVARDHSAELMPYDFDRDLEAEEAGRNRPRLGEVRQRG